MNRLIKTDNPESIDIIYEYGKAGAGNNSAGRITLIEDETGWTKRTYGKLGEVTEETRTIESYGQMVRNERYGDYRRWQASTQWGSSLGARGMPVLYDGGWTSTMSYTSDYLGRMSKITYVFSQDKMQ